MVFLLSVLEHNKSPSFAIASQQRCIPTTTTTAQVLTPFPQNTTRAMWPTFGSRLAYYARGGSSCSTSSPSPTDDLIWSDNHENNNDSNSELRQNRVATALQQLDECTYDKSYDYTLVWVGVFLFCCRRFSLLVCCLILPIIFRLLSQPWL